MSLIESLTAEEFFANFVVPLKRLNARRGVRYFERAADASRDSYWEDVSTRTGGLQQLPAGSGDAAALLDLLTAHWGATGDEALTRLAPHLKALQSALSEEPRPPAEEEAEVSDFVYPLY